LEEVELADPVCSEAGPLRGPPPSPEQPRSSREAFAVEATGARTGEMTAVTDARIGVSAVDNPADRPARCAGSVRIAPQHPGASPSAGMPAGPWGAIRAITRNRNPRIASP